MAVKYFEHATVLVLILCNCITTRANRDGRLLINDGDYQIHQLQVKMQELESKLNEKDAQIHALTEIVNKLQQSAAFPTTVGFYATLSAHADLGQQQTIDFDRTVTDTSNSYNNSTGVFTVPKQGLYQFSVTMFSTGTTYLHAEIMKNHDSVGNNYGNTAQSSATINVVLQCQQGDVVFVRHMVGQGHQTIHGSGYSLFSGFMIA